MKSPRETLLANLARAQRRIGRSATMVHGRQYAIGVEGTVIAFRCKRAGHVYKINFGSKRRPITARLSPAACTFHASWWSEAKGGCIGACPRCEKEAKTQPAEPVSKPGQDS